MSDVQSTVNYLPVKGFPGYRVGDDGSVWTAWKQKGNQKSGMIYFISEGWRLRKQSTNPNGRRLVTLKNANGYKTLQVHRLVLEAFVGPCPEDMECCHNDGNHTNNHLSNLRWDTHKANVKDRDAHGRTACGERSGSAKLTAEQVKEILILIAAKSNYAAIGRRFRVHASTVGRIASGRNWKSISPAAEPVPS